MMNEINALAMVPAALLGIPMMYWVLLGGTLLLSVWVSSTMKRRFREHSHAPLPVSGREVAERMLADAGISDVQVISTPGQLTDHYNPSNKTVNLSEAVYHERNVAAAAVAAHECGHAVQHARAYQWLSLRTAMVPITSLASNLMNIVFMIAIFGAFAFGNPALLWLIVICMGVTTAFSIVTLPVEFDASKRALAWMERSGMAASIDQGRARNALHWAAMTYVVAALSSLAWLGYYVFQLLGMGDE